MDLKSLIETHLDVERLAKDLDEVGHWARVWSVGQWTRQDMATLWEAVKSFRPISLDDFVPASVPPLVEVIHQGKNSLPAFTHFQKRFCRPAHPADGASLVGYNVQSFSALTGPGYYVAHASADPGEVEIDYTKTPREKPAGWPDVVPNRERLGRFVYHGLVDVMRGVSTHVTIGRNRKRGRWVDTWFVLVRDDSRGTS